MNTTTTTEDLSHEESASTTGPCSPTAEHKENNNDKTQQKSRKALISPPSRRRCIFGGILMLSLTAAGIIVGLHVFAPGGVQATFRGSRLYYLNSCIPSNVHLSPTTNVNAAEKVNMTVSFTLPEHCHSSVVMPIVWYGRQRGQLNSSSNFLKQASSVSSATATVESPIQFDFLSYDRSYYTSSWIHHVILPELQGGGESYWYSIQVAAMPPNDSKKPDDLPSLALLGKDAVLYNFTTPPLPSDPIRIAIVADWGYTWDSLYTMQGMLDRRTVPSLPPLSAVLVGGDISYANSHLPQWENWLLMVEPLVSTIPMLVTPGNHEIECDGETLRVFQAYESYFRNPNRIAEALREPVNESLSTHECSWPSEFMATYDYGNSFYSYRHGPLQIVVLNSYTNTTKGSAQYEWLKQELEVGVNRTLTPWLLVVFHCPFHTTFQDHSDEINPELMMQDMEPLFVEHAVNIVVSGHVHAYVRSVPMKQKRPYVLGPIYLTMGTGGSSHSDGPVSDQPEEWVAHRDNTEFGFGELYVVNASHAYLERTLNNGKKANPQAHDSVWIHNIIFGV